MWLWACLVLSPLAWGGKEPALDAITFHVEPGRLYVPLDEAAPPLRWRVVRDASGRVQSVNGRPVAPDALRTLVDGRPLASLNDLESWGATVVVSPDGRGAVVRRAWFDFTLAAGAQRVEIDLGRQRLTAWQGNRIVLQTRISSGKHGSTPAGQFRAGPYRARMHYSSRYHNAPMPWSVQIHGHVFIHGFTSVPEYPASHGCIRLPLTEGNPARFFYDWVIAGTPVTVLR